MAVPQDWAPEACTLPTEQRPLRVAEFDELFTWVLRSERVHETRLDLSIPAHVESAARDLARRESDCCSFFTFEFDSADDVVVMHVSVPPSQVEVLDAIERAQSQ
ncbi:MAG: hypothetical protein ACXWZR_03360 [Mycobacterium sp.]